MGELLNKLVIGLMPAVPKVFVGHIASRYIAGETIQDTVKVVRQLNDEGALATIDLLGEHNKNTDAAKASMEIYFDILETIDREKLNANISLKPTQLGLDNGIDFCIDLITKIVERATDLNIFVRIDMEDVPYTDDTLQLHTDLRKRFDNVGVVIQAYLRRTILDIKSLIKSKANLRLCKGIYNESRKVAYKDRTSIINNYSFLLEELLKGDCYVGIATHCEESVWHALKIIHQLGLKREQYEFQMLLGVDEELRRILLDAGHRLRVYVPFGKEWYPYSTRRLKENPRMAGYVMRDFLGMAKESR
ncbi:MAG: proline dehydrogenase family protein [Candidatus Electryoneaceae bacterium]|nr:proline dehydrogenase family protein [Candidatus Electryoneaceae bacterium]